MVATQEIRAGMIHTGKTVTVIAQDEQFRLIIDGETVGVGLLFRVGGELRQGGGEPRRVVLRGDAVRNVLGHDV
jgi:hypothetical protein